MAGPQFHGDPFTGYGYLQYTPDYQVSGFLEDFFGGRYRVKNGRLTDLQEFDEQGRHVYNPLAIGQQGEFLFAELTDNRYNVISETARGSANINIGNDALRMVAGPLSILDSDGNIRQFNIGPIPINNINHTWVAYLRDDGSWGYVNAPGSYASTGEVQAAFNVNYRLASPEEAAAQAIAKSIYLHNFDMTHPDYKAVEEYAIDEGLLKDDGTPNISGAIRKLMNLGDMSELQWFASSIVE